jgi:membrane associated rhomboid family serine protease
MFETLVMADRISNYATVSGFIVGLGVLLFIARTRRLRAKTTREDDKGKKVRYNSNGKPIYD